MRDERPKDAREAFAPHAEAYRVSKSHRSGQDLEDLIALLGARSEDTLLDVATGAGHTALTLAPHVQRAVGLDITPEMEEAFLKEAAVRGVQNATFVMAAAEAMPCADGAFSMVTMRRAAHHLRDIEAVLAEMKRVLRTGGRLGIADLTADDLDLEVFNAAERLRDPSHASALSPAGWQTLGRKLGLREIGLRVSSERQPFATWLSPFTMPKEAEQALRALLGSSPREAQRLFPDGAAAVSKMRMAIVWEKE